jgi:hypothetical protein
MSQGKNIDLSNNIMVLVDKFYVRPYIEKVFINDGKYSNQLECRDNIVNNFSEEIDKYTKNYLHNGFDDN